MLVTKRLIFLTSLLAARFAYYPTSDWGADLWRLDRRLFASQVVPGLHLDIVGLV